MATFHRHRAQLLASLTGAVLETAWSCTGPPTLAVAVVGAHVCMLTDEGGAAAADQQDCMVKNAREKDACALAWHPKQRVLAIAWKDGGVSLWKEQDRKLVDDTTGHKKPVSCMVWNSEGTRLVTGDQEGKVVVWKMDLRGKPTVVTRYAEKQDAVISHIRFDICAAPPADFVDPNLPPPCPPFYYAVSSAGKGTICHADDKGHRVAAFDVDCEVLATLYYPERNGLVVITASFTLTVHVRSENKWTAATKVKLNKAPDVAALQATWVGAHLLALASDKDASVHMTNLETEENSVLELPVPVEKAKKGKKEGPKVAAVAFHEPTLTLTVGATDGVVHMWRQGAISTASSPRTALSEAAADGAESEWEPLPAVELGSRITSLQWASNDNVISVRTQEGAHLLIRHPLARRLKGGVAVLQTGPSRVVVQTTDGTNSQVLDSSLQLTGLDFSDGRVLVWGKQKAEVYELSVTGLQRQAEFDIRPGACAAIFRDLIFRTASSGVEMCSLQGTLRQTLSLDEAHGSALCVDVHGDTLAVATSTGFLKLWRIAGREAKPVGPGAGRRLEMGGAPIGTILSVRCNCSGTKVSVLASASDGSKRPDSRLFLYDVELDAFQVYDFKQIHRRPTNHAWDGEEAQIVAVETESDADASQPDGLTMVHETGVQVTTLFATADHGILFQDKIDADPSWSGLAGLHVPFLFFASKLPNPQPLLHVPMRDFARMEAVDARTRRALLDFSYQMAVGNMDEAYRAVKLIRNPGVWANMASVCVKTRRLDVAEHCLGNMGHARAARAVREAKEKERETNAQIATVALHLGHVEDAHKLYVTCERWDLANRLLQSCGDWNRALEVAGKHDRVHLRATNHNFARHLEFLGDLEGAIKAYEVAGTHRHEVPRMLVEHGQMEELESYVQSSQDKELMKWWAKYCESHGSLEKALECYHWSGDVLSQVRIHCFQGDLASARALVDATGDRTAAFHVARQLELREDIPSAIRYFSRAEKVNRAARLAQRYGMDAELLGLALQGARALMLTSARYFEEKGAYDSAVVLYQKGGNLNRAVDLCFKGQLFDSLRTIADNLKDDADPALLSRCADFFLEHGQYEKAVHLLIAGKRLEQAVDLCSSHDVIITESMADGMTPPKADGEDPGKRSALVRRIAECCEEQGSFHLACKKYTQANERVRAMEALLKSGDTEKIIFFANVSRQRELYVLAANYLQSLDWHSDGEVMKEIIQFYTKAGAVESLAAFYDSCAIIEVDEYRDYEKALGAMRESLKYASKSRAPDRDARVADHTARIGLVELFVQARKLVAEDPKQTVALCNRLLEQLPATASQSECAVRAGDVYALLIELYYTRNDLQTAYQLLERMRERGIVLAPFLEQQMVLEIHQAVGIEMREEEGEEDDFREEELDEEVDDKLLN